MYETAGHQQQQDQQKVNFPTDLPSILERVELIAPYEYARNRNFHDGAVTQLSPYISRGVISTAYVMQRALDKGYDFKKAEKFMQELAWRDYWQVQWLHMGDSINQDLRYPQQRCSNDKIPLAIVEANTGIKSVDKAIKNFLQTGYMHNHMRMYVAALACNFGQSHWKTPAKWMYYHLLDGDWASNVLSWQWVAGTNSNKKYIMNQQNINKYWKTNQRSTFIDTDYAQLPLKNVPLELSITTKPELKVWLPKNRDLSINENIPTLVYTPYNLDPNWNKDLHANRILLLEPTILKAYPMAKKTIEFVINLSNNIPNIQLCADSFTALKNQCGKSTIHYKEHPLSNHFEGVETPRDWMFRNVKGSFRSFFSFWKKCLKSQNE